MTNTKLLEARIKESGYKRSYIAQKIGISTYTLQLKINNESEFKASEIKTLCELLKIESLEEVNMIFFVN